MNNNNFTIFTFYQFRKIIKINDLKRVLSQYCSFNKIRGTIILASEGINGTIAGLEKPVIEFEDKIKNLGFKRIEAKYSKYKYMPFNRMKIKIKKEIITFAKSNLDVEKNTATHIPPKKWNTLIGSKDTILIDLRNKFEIKIGTFKNAVNPQLDKFSDFKTFIKNNTEIKKNKKIAMFCTGGIRCEKASAYMIKKGYKDIYQLKGGILKYLEVTSKEKSKWIGECFVFDNRVSLKNELRKGSYDLCHGCRLPIKNNDKKSKKYEKGVSCKNCYNLLSKAKRLKLRERNKQIELAKKRGRYNPYIKQTIFNFF
ncbi:MAG: hypothetical protein CFH19_00587 [Alphaproteobacteria bacterium MarineAlpha5_Bin9]|nr:MAG: hypothetical protein CFH19_00587 [Alphaproteobacteria bacterium MarineAlpha5_Bin9]|tara:strand:+ start:3031 stop:3966 length:936 start_codon:yes stop_codon:yes gene_type:complete